MCTTPAAPRSFCPLPRARALRPAAQLDVRLDSAFFSEATLTTLETAKAEYTISVPFERLVELKGVIEARRRWRRIAADLAYFELEWKPQSGCAPARFVCVRTRVARRQAGPLQLDLFVTHDRGYEFKVIVTNKAVSAATVRVIRSSRIQPATGSGSWGRSAAVTSRGLTLSSRRISVSRISREPDISATSASQRQSSVILGPAGLLHRRRRWYRIWRDQLTTSHSAFAVASSAKIRTRPCSARAITTPGLSATPITATSHRSSSAATPLYEAAKTGRKRAMRPRLKYQPARNDPGMSRIPKRIRSGHPIFQDLKSTMTGT